MTKINLISVSVVTAALLISGCNDSDSSSASSSGGSADIAALKQPIVMDDAGVKAALGLLENAFTQFSGNTKLAKRSEKVLESIGARQEAQAEGIPIDCGISGTYENTSNYTSSQDENGSYSSDEWGTIWDNCVEASSNTVGAEPTNLHVRNGTRSYYYTSEYNNIDDTSKYTNGGADNYTESYESNETLTSRTDTYNSTGDFTNEQGITTSKFTRLQNGTSKSVDVNSTGDTFDGWEDVYENYSEVDESLNDGSAGTYTLNGAYSYAEGTDPVHEAEYYDNFVVEWTRMYAEKTLIINGTIGHLCLGGSVSVETTTTMLENQSDYFNGTGSTGSEVLPYAGNASLTGEDSVAATVAFETDEGNNTSAKLTVGTGEPTTHTSWSDLTDGSTCNIGPR